MLNPIPTSLLPLADNIAPLPQISSDIVFSDSSFISEGTHALIYKVTTLNEKSLKIMTCCLKVFRQGWMTPYNLETTAYAYLLHAGVKEHIPEVYGCGKRTLFGWGIKPVEDGLNEEYNAILMEFLEGAEQVTSKNVTVAHAANFANGLAKIHHAGVLHFDTFDRNMLVIPGSKRAVWIDFSCARIDVADYSYEQEAYLSVACPIKYVKSPRFHSC
jgi:predicted Ser/Thr protein kinase